MSGPEGNSFVFSRGLMFPEIKSRETSNLEGKQNCFQRDKTLSVLLYSDRDNNKKKKTS